MSRMSIRYEPVVPAGKGYKASVVATARSGATQLLTATGDDPRTARNAVDAKIDELSPEWWTA